MRVLLDLTALDTASRHTGTGRYLHELSAGLAALGPADRGDLDVEALIDLDGHETTAPLPFAGSARRQDDAGEARWLMRRRLLLPRTLRRLQPDLLHLPYHMGTPRGAGIPRVVTCLDLVRLILRHDYLPGRTMYAGVLWATETFRFRAARRVIAISRHTADDLTRLCGVPPRHIDVVPLGVNLDRYRPFAPDDPALRASLASLNLTPERYFFYAGTLDPRKNPDVLVASFARARLDGLELVLLGRHRPSDVRALEAALARAGHPAGVRPLGLVPEAQLAHVMAGALGLVFCSTYEGFGLPILEAMAAGCPVISTAVTSMAEIAPGAALIVPPRDIDATAQAMRQLASDATLRSELRRLGLARAAQFTWRTTALQTLDSYRRALA